jgi:regulator of nonsense transcripts 1
MEGAFTHLGNHLVSNSASTINAEDDESILDGDFSRLAGAARRRRQDDDEETDVFDDDDTESLASMAVEGTNGKEIAKAEEEVDLPPHACA